MANGWGGARPGSGGPDNQSKARQQANRDIVLDIAEAIHSSGKPYAYALWLSLFNEAINGNVMAAATIIPYIAGGRPKEPLVIDGTLRVPLPYSFPSWWSPPIIDTTATLIEAPKDDDDSA